MSDNTLRDINLDGEELWNDESVLRRLYHDEGMSLKAIGELLGTSTGTVYNRMESFEIDRRTDAEASRITNSKIPQPRTSTEGYVRVRVGYRGEQDEVYMHRLLAVVVYGFDEVCKGVVHHDNEIRWDNRPSNIELLKDHREHATLHGGLGDRGILNDTEALRELYRERGMYMREIADMVDCSVETVKRTLQDYDIPLRTKGQDSKELRERREKHLTEDGTPKDSLDSR